MDRHELEHELDASRLRSRDEPVEERALLDHVGLGLVEVHRHPVDRQAGRVEVGEEGSAAVVHVLRRVLRHAEPGRRRSERKSG